MVYEGVMGYHPNFPANQLGESKNLWVFTGYGLSGIGLGGSGLYHYVIRQKPWFIIRNERRGCLVISGTSLRNFS